ncbi:hypothetical protein MMC13_006298 [Lambiella insularis]|nr:hypothetical protein [Lambiella insularis]
MSPSSHIDDILTRYWRLDEAEVRRSKQEIQDIGVTVSSLTEQYLRARLQRRADATQNKARRAVSLASLAAAKISELLADADDVQAELSTIANSLSTATLRQLFRGGRLPYRVLRAFLNFPLRFESGNADEAMAILQDIDEAVLLNEMHIRSRGAEDNRDNAYLVTLESLGKILGKEAPDPSSTLTFRRKKPPAGGFEFFDEARERTTTIVITDEAYCENFQRVTAGVLDGLDWNHVLVAGEIALISLLHTDKTRDLRPEDVDTDIGLYLYGLDAAQANTKVEEVYEIWKSNLPATNQRVLVVKNAKTISFIPDYPHRRVRIVLELVLELLLSPTQILLTFDLDARAIGFNGNQVWMLPRCARAIEIGFNTFTMELVWGQYLGDRQASRRARIMKYADRGFGLRILPSYARSLEIDSDKIRSEDLATEHDIGARGDGDAEDDITHASQDSNHSAPRRKYASRAAYRLPDGAESGLKTLKRIAYLGEDFTNRYCFGNTPLHCASEIFRRSHPGTWIDDYEARKELTQKRINEAAAVTHPAGVWSYSFLDDEGERSDIPYGENGLSQFERLIRYAEAWKLTSKRIADFASYNEPICEWVYGLDGYFHSAGYEWNLDFSHQKLIDAIDCENDRLFTTLKAAISTRLNLPYQHVGYSGYLTRKIRRQVQGPDLKSVMAKQITIPLMMPYILEQFLLQELPNLCHDLPAHYLSNLFLITVHDSNNLAQQPSWLPSIHDTVSEAGNLRYWVISNTSMWACQNRVMDDVFDVLCLLSHYFQRDESHISRMSGFTCASSDAVWHMARAFRRRAVHPPTDAPHLRSNNDKQKLAALQRSGLTTREALLFRAWVFAEPEYRDRMRRREDGEPPFEEDAILYPVPDELFWKDGDEGDYGEFVAQWSDYPAEKEGRKRKYSERQSSSDAGLRTEP